MLSGCSLASFAHFLTVSGTSLTLASLAPAGLTDTQTKTKAILDWFLVQKSGEVSIFELVHHFC